MGSGRLHDDDVVRGNEVQRGSNPLVEQVRVNVFRAEIGNSQIESRSPHSGCIKIGRLDTDLPVQTEPSPQPAITLDQVVGKVSGQRDPDHGTEDEPGALS